MFSEDFGLKTGAQPTTFRAKERETGASEGVALGELRPGDLFEMAAGQCLQEGALWAVCDNREAWPAGRVRCLLLHPPETMRVLELFLEAGTVVRPLDLRTLRAELAAARSRFESAAERIALQSDALGRAAEKGRQLQERIDNAAAEAEGDRFF